LTLLGGAGKVGYMPSTINLAIIVADQAEVTEQEYTYLNMAAMYILASVSLLSAWVCSGAVSTI
jgi:hypothetical protein